MSMFLVHTFGIIFIILGVAAVVRHKECAQLTEDFRKNRPFQLFVAALEIIAGAFLVVGHQVWVWGPEVFVTLLGWLVLLEGLFYLFAPEKMVSMTLKAVNTSIVFIGGGITFFIIGIYLAAAGFGLL